MTKLMTYAAVVLAFGATAMLAAPGRNQTQIDSTALFATDGAFRDGLYLGQLAARSGRVAQPAIGRWSTERDRAMFAEGYRQGTSRQ
ncbi:MAG TPA: hypothetical protein VND65_12280 [Candidatus Binatia bacterium]|nr:hypothetical protein [Candidatus Binatia bacterium]